MYRKNGNLIRSERGVLIATLNDGVLTMAPGKKSQEAKVRAFLAESAAEGLTSTLEMAAESGLAPSSQDEAERIPEISGPETEPKVFVGDVPIAHVETRAEEKPQTSAEWMASTIPESDLPPFDAQLGVNTPGFGEFVSKYKLNKEQVGALIKRICRMKGW